MIGLPCSSSPERAETKRINGKQVYWVDSSPFNTTSGFIHKKLCDGYTFTAGTACAFSCRYCYVEAQTLKHSGVARIVRRSGRPFDRLVIRRRNAVQELAYAVTASPRQRGTPVADLISSEQAVRWGLSAEQRRVAIYRKPQFEGQVVFASPLVDVAATPELASETVDLCEVLLRLTSFDIRLLSKSPLLATLVARRLMEVAPDDTGRVIFGLSTGTLDDRLAAAIEPVPLPSARIKSLHWLQDRGFRTFGMLCPILPYQDPDEYAAGAMAALRAALCEDIWAEPVNFRTRTQRSRTEKQGPRLRNSFEATLNGLGRGRHRQMADRFRRIAEDPLAWEEYCRATYEACYRHAPVQNGNEKKLYWMQYPRTLESIDNYWNDKPGVLLLGGMASKWRQMRT